MNLFKRKVQSTVSVPTIPNGFAIFEDIKAHIQQAQQSIKVAAVWFTDHDLFQLLIDKQRSSSSCKIEVVLDDNKENYWLPFLDLVKGGALVKLFHVDGTAARMNERFCIIDNKTVLNGSYNWSKNARMSNHEKFEVSDDQSVVSKFETVFNDLLRSSVDYEAEHLKKASVSVHDSNDEEPFTVQFEKVLNQMIFAAVAEYDKEDLARKGFERSEKCAGDSAIITNELNTVYTEMMNSISASEQKKMILQAKVNSYLQESKFNLTQTCERTKEQLQIEEENQIRLNDGEIRKLEEENRRNTEEIVKLEKADISENEGKIKQLTEEKKVLEDQTVKMPFRWFVEIPSYGALFAVFVYIVLFYSSATYILIFSIRDAEAARRLKQPIADVGIYYSDALNKAYSKSFFELLMILLVPVFLIGGIIYLKKLQLPKYMPKWAIKTVCILFIDGFTAVAVTQSIHENKYLKGQVTEHFKLADVFSDMNFYLVFLFGMLSLLIFDVIFSYIIKNIEDRNDVHLKAKKQAAINLLTTEISALEKRNNELQAEVANKKLQIEHRVKQISDVEKQSQLLPVTTSRKKALLDNETAGQITNLENIVTIAYNKIENEIFSFSVHFMKDRINIFLQGWNNFIFSYYSKVIAEEKVRQANDISGVWFSDNFFASGHLKTYKNEIAV
jgi:hypothetical protein